MRIQRLCRPQRAVYIPFAILCICLIWIFSSCPEDTGKTAITALDNFKKTLIEKNFKISELSIKLRETQQKLDRIQSLNKYKTFASDIPRIYIITPTYSRPEQKAELTRLCQTFLHVKNLHWIIIEDFYRKTSLVTEFLDRCGVPFTHLNATTPENVKLKETDPNWLKPRGVLQRNEGLRWMRSNLNTYKDKGVLYFADDDNTYDVQLFDEMRDTKKISVWPVGLVGYLRYESPVVKNGKVTEWFTFWKPERTFAMDMAGFAVNIDLVLSKKEAVFDMNVPRGYQETTFLTKLELTRDDLEIKANGCTEILVWHTRTEKSKLKNEEKMKKKYGHGSDMNIEV